jgi:hypothetical protein
VIEAVCLGRERDGELRALARMPVPGSISLSYRREPDFFRGAAIQGNRSEILGVTEDGTLIAAVTRSVKKSYLDGVQAELGYWSGLRVLPGARSGVGLGRGYLHLRRRQEEDPVPLYLCTFIKRNQAALSALTGKRSILPFNLGFGEYHSYAMFARKRPMRRLGRKREIQTGPAAFGQELIDFLNLRMVEKQFAPAYRLEDFESGYLSCLDPKGWILLREGGRIVAAAARWSQGAFKQTVVEGYSGVLGACRPLLDACLRAFGMQALPEPGNELKSSYLSFIASENDDPGLLSPLVDRAMDTAWRSGDSFLLAGFHERDRLSGAAKGMPHIRYDSLLFVSGWGRQAETAARLDRSRVPYLELGTL